MQGRWRLLVSSALSHLLPVGLLLLIISQWGEELSWLHLTGIGLLAIILAWALWRTVVKPLETFAQSITEVAAGNLSLHTENATGLLAGLNNSLNLIINKLQEFFSRTQAETEVMAAEANRLRMILNSIQDGVLALDKDKHIILFNKAASSITGLEIEAVAGKHINTILPLVKNRHLVLSEWFDACDGADMQQKSWEDVTFTTGDNLDLSFDIEALYIGADPNGVRALITFHNRTEERQIEDMKVDFIALAAHELRTPITIIKGYLEILEQEIGPELSPEHQEFIRKLQVSATQLSGSINNILHVSHIEHGELNLHLEPTDWKSVVNEACIELAKKAESQGKKLRIESPDSLPFVSADRVSITEVLTNLVDNAVKYSQRGQTITIKLSKGQKSVITEIVDRGVGIPANAIGKLFTKFYRSHRTRTSHRGTGLGLYVCKTIVEAHGGRIWVESKEGEGSTFGFELPEVAKSSDQGDNDITRGVHGWIKNHSLYRG